MSDEHHYAPGDPIEERVKIKTGILWAGLIGLVTLIIVSMGLMRAFQLALADGVAIVHPSDKFEQQNRINRSAPLDYNQRASRKIYDDKQAHILDGYGWIDQKQNLAHIPVSRAMELIVSKYGKTE
ncbi:hypothetical protein SH668x_002090 [Planctomicrobium sp. SH668]|uniref:hypothetical protein n=1 Tax=Planctomicrobium sp. SH668 TaxID=3448126 RepID=UPI003F5B5E4E